MIIFIMKRHIIGKNFFEDVDFGLEGTLPTFPNWELETISREDLKVILINASYSINPEINKKWIESAESNLLEAVLGEKDEYNIKGSLMFLRNIAEKDKTSEQRLVQRAVSIKSYDLLNPVSIAKQDLKTLYLDLCLDDPELLPEGRDAGAVNKIAFRFYQDDERRYKFHIYPPNTLADEYPHEHYGDSASVILKGALVNQHFSLNKTDDNTAEFGLYVLKKAPFEGKNQRVEKKLYREGNVNLDLITSHCYRAGDHYLLPAPASRDGISSDKLIENDKLTFHQVATEPNTVTIFAQRFSKDITSYTTDDISGPEIITKEYTKPKRIMTPEEAGQMMKFFHRKILEELEGVEKPSTIIDRSKGKPVNDILIERLYIKDKELGF